MPFFGRMIVSLAIALVCIFSGCATTHPRRAPNLDGLIAKPKRIALLRPKIDARVKYIDTPEFFYSASRAGQWEAMVTTGMRRSLEMDGHEIFHYLEIGKLLPGGERELKGLGVRLTRLTEPAIEADADYAKKSVPKLSTGESLIPKQLKEKVDFIVAIKGRSKIETIKEFYARWTRNIGFNLMTFPITAASAFIPVPLPISVTISTSLFEPSPEDIFVSVIIIDVKTREIVYQNDYFSTSIPSDDEELQELGFDLLEDFTKHDD